MLFEEINIELQCFILEMLQAGLENLSKEYQLFRQFQKRKSEDGSVGCDEQL
jgi:hypothetical protein